VSHKVCLFSQLCLSLCKDSSLKSEAEILEQYKRLLKSKTHHWRSDDLEFRWDRFRGRHPNEICLIGLLEKLRDVEKSGDFPEEDIEHWRIHLCYEVVRSCLHLGKSPESFLFGDEGFIVVKQETDSALYFECMALHIRLSRTWEIRNFLDFHLVNCRSGRSQKSTYGVSRNMEHTEAGLEFLRGLERITRRSCEPYALKTINDEPLKALERWLTFRYDRMGFKELEVFRRFEYSSDSEILERSPMFSEYKEGSPRIFDAGCSLDYLKAFFALLEKSNPKERGRPSFVPSKILSRVLHSKFGVGQQVVACSGIEAFVDLRDRPSVNKNQLCWFAAEFIKHRGRRKKGCLTTKELLMILYHALPEVFDGVAVGTICSNYRTYAKSADVLHLDWRNYPELRAVIEREKMAFP
jgi:hypothetical protein